MNLAQRDYLRGEYQSWQALFDAQPTIIQHFLQAQARQIADALIERSAQARFTLPDRVLIEVPDPNSSEGMFGSFAAIPADMREQMAGGLLDRLTVGDIRKALRQRLSELESSPERAVAVGAGLMRHATAVYMVHDMLPAGRSVTYIPAESEEIPTIPTTGELEPESAITAQPMLLSKKTRLKPGVGNY
jgi:hypothetical protein